MGNRTVVAMPFVALLLFCAAAPAAAQYTHPGKAPGELSKIDGRILVDQVRKQRAATLDPEERKQLEELGVRLDHPHSEEVAFYVRHRLAEYEIEALAADGIRIEPTLWVPPVENQHPYGYYLGKVNYDSLQLLQDDDRFVRVASAEHRFQPQSDMVRLLTP